MGIYDIEGNVVDEMRVNLKNQQPGNDCCYENGFNYPDSFRYTVPHALRSGLYLVANKIPFVVKNPDRSGDIVVVYPSNTAAAYDEAGGKSLYSTPDRATKVSFKRPVDLASSATGFLKWAWNSGYTIDYITDADLEDMANFNYAKLIIIAGHSEYWTRKARKNFDAYIDDGGNALILSGNTMWWQVRYGANETQMICYKDLTLDPEVDPLLKTITWDAASLTYPIYQSIGVEFSRGGYGMNEDDGWNGYKIIDEGSPILTGTGLKTGAVISCLTDEYDGAPVHFDPVQNQPVWDSSVINFYRKEIIGYDFGFRTFKTIPTFIVFQKTSHSGIIINVSSSGWCEEKNFLESGTTIWLITHNCIHLLLNEENVFSN